MLKSNRSIIWSESLSSQSQWWRLFFLSSNFTCKLQTVFIPKHPILLRQQSVRWRKWILRCLQTNTAAAETVTHLDFKSQVRVVSHQPDLLLLNWFCWLHPLVPCVDVMHWSQWLLWTNSDTSAGPAGLTYMHLSLDYHFLWIAIKLSHLSPFHPHSDGSESLLEPRHQTHAEAGGWKTCPAPNSSTSTELLREISCWSQVWFILCQQHSEPLPLNNRLSSN